MVTVLAGSTGGWRLPSQETNAQGDCTNKLHPQGLRKPLRPPQVRRSSPYLLPPLPSWGLQTGQFILSPAT